MTDETLNNVLPVPVSVASNKVARRARLRDFQTQLMERMQAAKSGSHARANQLGVLIGRSRYLIDLKEAGEIVTSGNLTSVPLTKAWYLGVSNVRGSLTSVVDFSLFDGGEPTIQDSSCRVLAFSNALSFNSAIMVSKVLGLRNADEMELIDDASADAVEGGVRNAWILNRFLDNDGNRWSQLSLQILVQDQNFLHIGL